MWISDLYAQYKYLKFGTLVGGLAAVANGLNVN
jgi:hypothetical protein